jgi:uncharacterized protein YqeY
LENRKESARIFTEQNRLDLAEPELAQIAIEKFLPEQLSSHRSCAKNHYRNWSDRYCVNG